MQMDQTDEIYDGIKTGLNLLIRSDDQSCLQSENSLMILKEHFKTPTKEENELEYKEKLVCSKA